MQIIAAKIAEKINIGGFVHPLRSARGLPRRHMMHHTPWDTLIKSAKLRVSLVS